MSDQRKEEDQNAAAGTAKGELVWAGRPAVGAYVAIYGIVLLVVAMIAITVEYWVSSSSPQLSFLLPSSVNLASAGIPYPVELATALVLFLAFLTQSVRLSLLQARSKYSLYKDGLYLDSGIINLENVFVAPVAFSDARLIRTWSMRAVNRGLIIVDANDGRHFSLQMIKDPLAVQSLIRSTLARPRVKLE